MYAKSPEERKSELTKDIQYMINSIRLNKLKFDYLGYKAFARAKLAFGFTSPMAREALVALKEVNKMSAAENRLFTFILKNLDVVDLDSAKEVELELERINDSAFTEYFEMINQIEFACKHNDASLYVSPEGDIKSVLSNGDYARMVVGLTEKFSDIKAFLNYEPEFWEFIKPNLRVVPVPAEGAKVMCGLIPITDTENNLQNFYTVVPEVRDMDTAYIALDLYKRAHDMFLHRGKNYSEFEKKTSNNEQLEYRELLTEKAHRVTK